MIINLLQHFKDLILSTKEDDNDEELSQRVKSIERNGKNNEKKTTEGISASKK